MAGNSASAGHSWDCRTGRTHRRPRRGQPERDHTETSDNGFQPEQDKNPFKSGNTSAQNEAKNSQPVRTQDRMTTLPVALPSHFSGNQRPPRARNISVRPKEHMCGPNQQFLSKRATSQPNPWNINHNRTKMAAFHSKRVHTSAKLDMTTLEKILQMEPSEVVLKLTAPGSGLNKLLSTEVTDESFVSMILDVLNKACSCRTKRQNLRHLLVELKESKFLKCSMPPFIMNIDEGQAEMDGTIDKLNKIMDLYLTLLSIFPSSTFVIVSLALSLLETQLTKLHNGADFNIPEETENKLKKLQTIITHLKAKKLEGTFRSDNYTFLLGDHDESSQDNFRFMSVLPTFEDIHTTEKPFIRPNIVNEKFKDSNTYLDTHFRLLREDFIKPLRDGISHLLMLNGDDRRQQKPDDIRIYFDAQISYPVFTSKGILYKITFDTKNLKYVNWESSKRLLYGALVCLSMDNFRTMIFATVGHRNIPELYKGIIYVCFNEENRLRLANISQKNTFVMVETTAFFEAYRHVLEGLQETEAQDLPMQKYIVRCESEISPPNYLQAKQNSYSLLALMNNDSHRKVSGLHKHVIQSRRLTFLFERGPRPLVDKEILKDILDLNDWPSKEELGLDSSQMKAVQLALTKELAIIQGPPGTGKTHVGLKIVKALLDNAHVWSYRHGGPILVVCYTNHALDQFLEGIIKFMENPDGLVRVGGQTSSETVKCFSLHKLRRKSYLHEHQKAMHTMLNDDMKMAEKEIEEATALLESSQKGILRDYVLRRYIVSLHGCSLEADRHIEDVYTCSGRKQTVILEWLGLPMLNSASRSLGATPGKALRQETACLSLVTPVELEDAVSGNMEGDQGTLDCFQREQAERMMDGDDVEKLMQNANRRRTATQREALAYMPEEEEEEEKNQDCSGQGWAIQKEMKRKLKWHTKTELQKTEHMTEREAVGISDLWALSNKQRWSLYRLWVSLFRNNLKKRILKYEQDYQEITARLDELRSTEDEMLLKRASVIGMTTTCAARYRKVLQGVQPKIVVVEEAAEVLEAHIVTALTSACEHLILIGDHQQLRPSATVYELAMNFNLEVSLFERLIEMNIPYVRLDYQHRMRPEIARLLTPYIYDQLENDPSVFNYENIKGVMSNVFFVEHEHFEENISEGRSHRNMHEATFVKGLCNYLICQGYKPSQITVLTTYTGQLFCLKQAMSSKHFMNVKLCVVDRYQGEENDIVILSLVRSNKDGKAGFLKIPNRVCVALSRAKKGLFCIGNLSMLSSVPLWSKIREELNRHGQTGKALNLRCENHPSTITAVSEASDFSKVPLGGCSLPCEYRLDCGHVCPRLCHPVDDHKKYKCLKPCTKTLCEDGHKCPKVCSANCGKCQVSVTKTIPGCNHEQQVPCSVPAAKFVCTVPCTKALPCGHVCVCTCGEPCTSRCLQKVTVVLECGHERALLCYVKQEADSKQEKIQCLETCQTQLECGHICSGNCFRCHSEAAHVPCEADCEVLLLCSHNCKGKCGGPCVPCSARCDKQCVHGSCPRLCWEVCQPCTKRCSWRCRHKRCTRLCYEPCDRPPCQMPCLKRLPCQHQCIGMCGEPCPDKCRICDSDDVRELFFGKETDPKARFVQLLDCNHIFEVTGFDSWMMSVQGNVLEPKTCPKCYTPIRRTVRYGAVVKGMLLEIEALKVKVAEMYSKYITNSVKEKEIQGISSPMIPLLLRKLEEPALNVSTARDIHKQVVHLFHLAEITKNTAHLPSNLRIQIEQEVQSYSSQITSVKDQSRWQLKSKVRRVQVLAEALVCLDKLDQSQHGISSPLMQERRSLVRILSKINNRPTERDLSHMCVTLSCISEKLKVPIEWSALKETDSDVAFCDFLKLSHWTKCSEGHTYYNQPADSANETSCCPECTAG